MPSSRGSSHPRDRTQVSCIEGGFLTIWATREAQEYWSGQPISSLGDLSQPRNQTRVSCIAGGFFSSWAIRKAPQLTLQDYNWWANYCGRTMSLFTRAWSRLPKLRTWRGTVLCRKIKSMKVEGNKIFDCCWVYPQTSVFQLQNMFGKFRDKKERANLGQPEGRGMEKECSLKQQMTAENNNQEWKWFGLNFVPLKICVLKPEPPVWLYVEIRPLRRLSEIIKIGF